MECRVAPHAGAWIETDGVSIAILRGLVAPHAGAWIETETGMLKILTLIMSLPMRERGLKPVLGKHLT